MTRFTTDSIFQALRQPLALVEDQERRQAFERYVEAARTSLERSVFDLLSTLVQEVDAQVQEHYRARLQYQPDGLELEVQPVQREERPDAAEEPAWSAAEGGVEKITIRIPAELKDLVTQAAARGGTSLNSWLIRTLARTLRDLEDSRPAPPPPPSPPGRGARLSGWLGGE